MYTVIKEITPENAKELLLLNTNNYRKLNETRVSRYSDDMKHGRWQNNAEPIRISKGGVLLDGQHRLKAIIKSGTSQEMLIVYDVDDSVNVFDVGSKRTRRQIGLQMNLQHGALETTSMAAAASVLSRDGGHSSSFISDTAVLKYISMNEAQLSQALSVAISGKSGTRIAKIAPCVTAAYYLIKTGEDQSAMRRFFSVINTGFSNDVDECSPAIVVRNWILANGKKYSYEIRRRTFAITILAYRDFINSIPRRRVYNQSNEVLSEFSDFCDHEIKSVCEE